MLHIDLRPNMPHAALIQNLKQANANQSLSNCLRKIGFSPVAMGLLREAMSPAMLATITAEALAECLKAVPVQLTATTGIERAISTAGGIARHALTPDYRLRSKPTTFVAGEMLDWEAPTGGYLLQACFSTAVAAAHGIIAFLESPNN